MQVSLKICISQSSEPPLVHLLHKFLSDGIAGGIADDGVDVAVRANGRGLLGRYIVGDFRGWEDTTTGETAALLRQLYLRPVAETGVLSPQPKPPTTDGGAWTAEQEKAPSTHGERMALLY